MWTARDATDRLRRETGCGNLYVRFDSDRERWVVLEKTRRLTGRRPWVGGTIREAVDHFVVVHTHEGPDGEYLSLDPNAMVAALWEKDTSRMGQEGYVDGLMARVAEVKRRKQKEWHDKLDDVTKYEAAPRIAQWADRNL